MAQLPASEFGGKPQRNGIQPPLTPQGKHGHSLTVSERLRMIYTTGQDADSTRDRDGGEAFTGILPLAEQLAVMPKPELYIDTAE